MPTDTNKIIQISENLLERIGSFVNLKGKTLASIIIFIFNSTIYFPFLSNNLFVIYMLEHGFFSYDFFTNGLFGMKVFTYTLIIFMLMLSLVMFGSVSLYMLRYKQLADKQRNDAKESPEDIKIVDSKKSKNLISKKFISVISLINLAMIIMFGWYVFHTGFVIERFFFFFILLFLCGYLALHIGYVLTNQAKEQIRAALFLGFVTVIFLVFAHDHISKVLGSTLRMFGAGGNLEINIISNQNTTTGKLIFLAPKNIYYKTPDNNLVIRDTKGLEIHILNNGETQIKGNY